MSSKQKERYARRRAELFYWRCGGVDAELLEKLAQMVRGFWALP